MDIQKLMMAKAIMDKTTQMDSKGVSPKQSQPRMQVENFDVPSARYNIPQEMLAENPIAQQPVTTKFMNQGYPAASVNAIQKSKLPDEIKKLMIEHPIDQPGNTNNVTLSDDLVERASRLMGTSKPVLREETQQVQQTQTSQLPNTATLKKMMKQVVKEVLKENGMLVESVEKSNDNFKFQVGNHIFEGKLTKIKKLS